MRKIIRRSSLLLALLSLAWHMKCTTGSDESGILFSDTAETLKRGRGAANARTRAKRSTTGFAYHSFVQ